MTTLVLGPRPPELQALIDKRRELGLDGHDEVWDGVYVMSPFAHSNHGAIKSRVVRIIDPYADRAGLVSGDSFNVGDPNDFRVPDAGWHWRLPGRLYVPSAPLLLEVLSPDDRTLEKRGFYAAHGVQELLVADGVARAVRCFLLREGVEAVRPRSALLDVTMVELSARVDWP